MKKYFSVLLLALLTVVFFNACDNKKAGPESEKSATKIAQEQADFVNSCYDRALNKEISREDALTLITTWADSIKEVHPELKDTSSALRKEYDNEMKKHMKQIEEKVQKLY